ncbi:alanine racemase [Neokomagataea thailandica NBRC 106555]|nr:alanine racemase [Neokomagataea thailandica NBRC 106555]
MAGAWLTIDRGVLADNYRHLDALSGDAECAAVIKADGYGLGAEQIAPTLYEAGAKTFFVAHLVEGIRLRPVVPEARIFVLHGFMPGCAKLLHEHNLIPALNDVAQVREWAALGADHGQALPCAVQVDSGMSRFGLSAEDIAEEGLFDGVAPCLVMSHLACADTPENPANAAQRQNFLAMAEYFPGVPRSLAASSGIFLGPDYHFELVRPGAALYGVAPNDDTPSLGQVARLMARITQIRTVPAGGRIGYGLTWEAQRPTRVATLGIGYADGFFRAQAGSAAVWYGEQRLPLLGRVSMDSISVDLTNAPVDLEPGDVVTVLGAQQSVDALAASGKTIGYEILTSLGARFYRVYL